MGARLPQYAVAPSSACRWTKIRVVAPFVGGGFGAKCFTWPHSVMAAFATLDLDVPVRLVLSRAQMHLATGCRPAAHQTITLGADRQGHLSAIRQHAISQTSVGDIFVRAVGEVSEVLYALPNLETRNTVLRVNTTTPTNMRAPGESYGSFALETAMDMLAEKTGIDPVELRLRNIPQTHPEDGTPFSTNALKQCLDEGAAAFGWDKRSPEPGSMREGEELIGWGMSAACYGNYRSQAEVRATAYPDGTVEIASATHEIGSGTTTLMAQVAADALSIDIARIRVSLGDTGASRRTRAWRLAQCRHHRTRRRGGGDGAESRTRRSCREWRLARQACGERSPAALPSPAGPAPPNSTTRRSRRSPPASTPSRMPTTETAAMYAYAAHFCEVRIRPDLGRLRVTRMLSRCDIGRVLNPMQARSQILGGLVFGLGMALSEQIVPDFGTGRVISAGITEYWLPGMPMMPEFDIGFVGPPDYVSNEMGAKGGGEIGTVGSAAAIANAVWHATGRRFQQLPITVDKLLSQPLPATRKE